MAPVLVSLHGHAGPCGPGDWAIVSNTTVKGAPQDLHGSTFIMETEGVQPPPKGTLLTLAGMTNSNLRYTSRKEMDAMMAKGPNLLGRSESTLGALVLLKKDDAWWSMVQDERSDLLLKSRHVEMGLKALPNIARRLHHVRDMPDWDGEWDFLTWFEYSPEDEHLFDELLVGLRASPEWGHIEREVDIRLKRCY